ncbi:hypothetical protein BH11BAC7_BH11BAC7_15590 [soil metagenome]
MPEFLSHFQPAKNTFLREALPDEFCVKNFVVRINEAKNSLAVFIKEILFEMKQVKNLLGETLLRLPGSGQHPH